MSSDYATPEGIAIDRHFTPRKIELTYGYLASRGETSVTYTHLGHEMKWVLKNHHEKYDYFHVYAKHYKSKCGLANQEYATAFIYDFMDAFIYRNEDEAARSILRRFRSAVNNHKDWARYNALYVKHMEKAYEKPMPFPNAKTFEEAFVDVIEKM